MEDYIKRYHNKLISFPKEKSKKWIGWSKKILDTNKSNLIKEILDRKTDLDSETKKNYSTHTNLIQTKEFIKKKMNIIKEQEILRLCNEVLVNDYLRRFRVSQKHLFSSVVGEDEATSVMAKLKYEWQVSNQI